MTCPICTSEDVDVLTDNEHGTCGVCGCCGNVVGAVAEYGILDAEAIEEI